MTSFAPETIRTVRFSPYRKGMGPTFTLVIRDTHRTVDGKHRLDYTLTMRGPVDERNGAETTELFAGADFGCSPLHAIDSDETVKALMGFLTLRPGDTDAEYFEHYHPIQLEYCSQHAEALSAEVYNRFGE